VVKFTERTERGARPGPPRSHARHPPARSADRARPAAVGLSKVERGRLRSAVEPCARARAGARAEAQEAGDAWAAAALNWMLGRHADALRALLPADGAAPPGARGAAHPASPDAAALDFLAYCAAAASALAAVAAGEAAAVAATADRAAAALAACGLPAMALEAATLAEAAVGTAAGPALEPEAAAARVAGLAARRARLAAGALLWAALGAPAAAPGPDRQPAPAPGRGLTRLAPGGGAAPWRAAAEAGLGALAAAGLAGLDGGAVLAELGALRGALAAPPREAPVPDTPCTPASLTDAGGRQSLGYVRRRCARPRPPARPRACTCRAGPERPLWRPWRAVRGAAQQADPVAPRAQEPGAGGQGGGRRRVRGRLGAAARRGPRARRCGLCRRCVARARSPAAVAAVRAAVCRARGERPRPAGMRGRAAAR